MKAAYGTFLSSLMVIKCHDMVADLAADRFNVIWGRTTPVVVSCCDDAASTYLTGEMDHRMGMTVLGDPEDVWAFRFACSSAFSPIENMVMDPDRIGSVTMGIGERILNGEVPEMFMSNGYLVLKIKDRDDLFLLVDPQTGIVRDIDRTVCGAYCFHDQITNRMIQLAESLISTDPLQRPEWLSSIGTAGMTAGSTIVTGETALLEIGGAEFIGTGMVTGGAVISMAVAFAILAYEPYFWLYEMPEKLIMLQELSEIPSNSTALSMGGIALFLPDDRYPTHEDLQEACWKANQLLMLIAEKEDKSIKLVKNGYL